MPFTELDLKRIDRTVGELCRRKSPPQHRHQLRFEYRIHRQDVLIYETRPAFREPSRWTEHGIAKLRYVRTAGEWRLFWQRASLKWQSYEPLASSRNIAELVAEIERDSYNCFFG
jgi:hypothetical protein